MENGNSPEDLKVQIDRQRRLVAALREQLVAEERELLILQTTVLLPPRGSLGRAGGLSDATPPALPPVERQALPFLIANAMDAWRAKGCWPHVPESYVAWHLELAHNRLTDLAAACGLRVYGCEVRGSGWMDGMKELRAMATTRTGRSVVLQWADSNQDFMVVLESGGQRTLGAKDLA